MDSARSTSAVSTAVRSFDDGENPAREACTGPSDVGEVMASWAFEVEPGRNTQGEDIIWIDYDAAVSMHRVRTANKADRRLERLATPSVAANRIS